MSNRNSILVRIIVWGVVALILLGAFTVLISRAASGPNAFNTPVWGELRVIQEESFPIDEIGELEFDFSSIDIAVYPAQGNELQVKLLANRELRQDERFVSSSENGRILVQNKPLFETIFLFSINSYKRLEVYLPAQYSEKLAVTTASGNVTLPDTLTLKSADLGLTSGNLSGGSIAADTVKINLTSGNITLGAIKSASYSLNLSSGDTKVEAIEGAGDIDASSGNIRIGTITGGEQVISASSGDITVEAFTGSGSISTQSGNIRLANTLVQGDLNVRVTSGDVSVGLTKDAAVRFEAAATSGDITSSLPVLYLEDNKRASGEIGENPSATLSVRTTSGNIRLSQAE